MYLITAYFDDTTNKKLERLIDGIADCSGNFFMKEHNVPPHLTISAFETRKPEGLIPVIEKLNERLLQGEVQFVSLGVFLPYVMYVTPVLDGYLHDMAVEVYDSIQNVKEDGDIPIVNRFYHPSRWFPHVTLGKTLDEEQMRQAFSYMQTHFVPVTGRIVELGLSRTNPHEDIVRIVLKCYR